jgi:hypothetical protein
VLIRLRRSPEIARVALWVFVHGVIVFPCLHQINHRADHVHDGDGDWELASGHPGHGVHDHLGDGHRHDHAHPHAAAVATPPPRPGAHGARGTVDRGALDQTVPTHAPHGRGSLAHFGLAVPAIAVFALPPPWSRAEPLAPAIRVADRPRTPPLGLPEARGPPAV